MTLYLSNRDGDGKTDEVGHFKPVSFMLDGITDTMTVSQTSPISRGIIVNAGHFMVDTTKNGDSYTYFGWKRGVSSTIMVGVADAANPRIDVVVVYIDRSAVTSASPPNNPGIPQFAIVQGVPLPTPSAPNASAIQSAIGANNPYAILATINVPANATEIINANITNINSPIRIADNLVKTSSIQDGNITTNKLATGAVTSSKIANDTITKSEMANGAINTAKFKPTIIQSNFTPQATRWSGTGAVWHNIPGCSMSYTAGNTPEKLLIRLSVMATKSAGSAEVTLAVNGVRQTIVMYINSASPWHRATQDYVISVAANSVTSLSVVVIPNDTNTAYITNESAKWMPTITGISVYDGP